MITQEYVDKLHDDYRAMLRVKDSLINAQIDLINEQKAEIARLTKLVDDITKGKYNEIIKAVAPSPAPVPVISVTNDHWTDVKITPSSNEQKFFITVRDEPEKPAGSAAPRCPHYPANVKDGCQAPDKDCPDGYGHDCRLEHAKPAAAPQPSESRPWIFITPCCDEHIESMICGIGEQSVLEYGGSWQCPKCDRIWNVLPDKPAAAPQPDDFDPSHPNALKHCGLLTKDWKPATAAPRPSEPAPPSNEMLHSTYKAAPNAPLALHPASTPLNNLDEARKAPDGDGKAAEGDAIDKLVANVQRLHADDFCECGHSKASHEQDTNYTGLIEGACAATRCRCKAYKGGD